MPFEHVNSRGVTYYLHQRDVVLRGGQDQRIFFFARDIRPGAIAQLPAGYAIVENDRNGFLALRSMPDSGITPENPREPVLDAAVEVDGLAPTESVRLDISSNGAQIVLTTDTNLAAAMPSGDLLRVVERHLAAASRLSPALRQFEDLLATADVRESELQEFLQDFPEILLGADYDDLKPQVVIEASDGDLIPDFILKPVGRELWDIVELKLPSVRLLTHRRGRPQLTRATASGISQLLDYAEALEDPQVRSRLHERYGVEVFRPRLQLTIGRLTEFDERDIVRASDPRVEVLGWDALLARARRHFLREP